jgi:hypothetical protein
MPANFVASELHNEKARSDNKTRFSFLLKKKAGA